MIYALSDIHGCLDALEDAMARIGDLDDILTPDSDNILIFLGDYVDGGPESASVLCRIHELQQRYPDNVIVLKGNHDDWLLDFLTTDEPLFTVNFTEETLTSFLPRPLSIAFLESVLSRYSQPLEPTFWSTIHGWSVGCVRCRSILRRKLRCSSTPVSMRTLRNGGSWAPAKT